MANFELKSLYNSSRAHNVDVMTTIFKQRIQRLPDATASIFTDNIKQMHLVGYPKYLRQNNRTVL
jgi:hypothetical protein